MSKPSPAPSPSTESTIRGPFDFVIAGASKAGTTYLHHALRANSAVSMPDNEIIVLHSEYYSAQALSNVTSELDYSRLVGIKRPNYIFDMDAMYRLRDLAPNARILVVLRDPVVRAISHFYHLRRYAQIAFVTFDEMANALLNGDLLRLKGKAYELEHESCYRRAITRTRALFGDQNVCLINFETMKDEPDEVMNAVCDFLGFQPQPVPAMSVIPQKVIYAEEWQRLWAASCKIEGICNEDGMVVAYRNQPLSESRSRRVAELRARAHEFYDDAKPSFPAGLLDAMKEHFRDEYSFLSEEGIDLKELDSLTRFGGAGQR